MNSFRKAGQFSLSVLVYSVPVSTLVSCCCSSGDKYGVNLSADQTMSERRDLDHMIDQLPLSRQ